MNPAVVSLLAGSPALDLLVKATLLLGAGLVGSWLARRRSAATRHLVWLVAVSGSLALVPLTLVAPRLVVSLPAPPAVVPALVHAKGPLPVSSTVTPTVSTSVADPPAGSSTASRAVTSAPTAWPSWLGLALVWLAGALAVLLWSAAGHRAIRGLGRSASTLEPGTWPSLIAGEPRARGVRFGLSPTLGTPLTWGWRRPVVLFPASASSWPDDRRRVALLHELAHVARRDYLAQAIATLACAVYWFHPLVWWAATRMRCESEHACDDQVLAAGTPAPAYASDLLEVARGARELRAVGFAAVGMAHRSHLEGRLLAVLDEARPRRGFSRRAGVTAIAAATAALVLLAGLRPTLVAAAASPGDPAARARVVAAVAPDPPGAPGAPGDSRGSGDLSSSDDSPGSGDLRSSSDSHGSGDSGDSGDSRASSRSHGSASSTAASNAARSSSSRHVLSDAEGTYSVPAAAGGSLDLDFDTGAEVEIRGWDRSEVEVQYELGGRDWRDSRFVVERANDGVSVHSYLEGDSRFSSTSHRLRFRVPRHFDLHLRSAGGGVSLSDLEGAFEGNTGGGEISIEHVRGHAHLATGGGEIRVSDSDLTGSVSTGGGTVRLSKVSGGLRGSSGSGPVIYTDSGGAVSRDESTGDLGGVDIGPDGSHIEVAPHQNPGYLHIRRAGGDVDLDDAPAGGDITTGGGDIHVRHGAGKIRVRTGGGDIEVGPVAGSVRGGTGAGDIEITLDDVGGAPQTVDVSTGLGRVILHLPPDLNARFELEAAYTRGSADDARITSDWSLDRDPVTGWDSSEGTPRRYVRAHGVAGDGRGLIRVRTVNGDIEVHRKSR